MWCRKRDNEKLEEEVNGGRRTNLLEDVVKFRRVVCS